MPTRIRLSRKKGYRKPEDAIVVARPTRWGNPFQVGETQLRFPRIDGTEAWEQEGRLHKRSGAREPFHHSDFTIRPDGSKQYRVTIHEVRDATLAEVVAMYHEYIAGGGNLLEGGGPWRSAPSLETIRQELAGRDLACWCPLDQPCHADVLLELANPTEESRNT